MSDVTESYIISVKIRTCKLRGLRCPVQSASAAAPAQLAPPPPPPVSFASSTNSNGANTASSTSTETSYASTIGDVFTYEPKGGGAIESAGPIGPPTTALTTRNGKTH